MDPGVHGYLHVVLGGGGSRGLAHQGIIKSLEEHKVPIDYIGGTSQGSFMAAIYAIHQSSKVCAYV